MTQVLNNLELGMMTVQDAARIDARQAAVLRHFAADADGF